MPPLRQPPRRLPRFLAVLDELRGDTRAGTWRQRLPPEPELAQRYGVSRTTLRKAIAALVEEGVLEPRHGSGTYIRELHGAASAVRTVGLLVAPGVGALADDPYMQQLTHHLLVAFARHGWTLRLAASSSEMGLRLAAGQGAPVVACIAALYGRGAVDELAALPVPVVLVDSEPLAQAPVILADNAAGMSAAVARLVQLGHRRIAHIAGPDYAAAGRERLGGYRAGMAAAGLAAGPVVQDGFSIDNGHRALAAWWALPVRERPTAVLCANDLLALGALRWLAEHGLRAGREVSIIGCDDLLAARLAWPGLATLALDFAAHAEAVVQGVLSSDRPGIRRTSLTLIERESLGPAPAVS